MPTHRDVHSNYPPSPPQLPPRLGPPSLRINTANSQRPGPSHGRSDARQPPLYDLPSKLDSSTANAPARARPGGLAAIHGSRSTEDPARVRSPPGTPHSHAARSRRGSQETTARPPNAWRESDQSLPMPSRRDNTRGRSSPSLPSLKSPTIGGSVFSGREGSSHAARLEATGPTQAVSLCLSTRRYRPLTLPGSPNLCPSLPLVLLLSDARRGIVLVHLLHSGRLATIAPGHLHPTPVVLPVTRSLAPSPRPHIVLSRPHVVHRGLGVADASCAFRSPGIKSQVRTQGTPGQIHLDVVHHRRWRRRAILPRVVGGSPRPEPRGAESRRRWSRKGCLGD